MAGFEKLGLGFAEGGEETDRLAGERERERAISPFDPLNVFYFLTSRIFNGLTGLTCN